jgi:hypothetical protein
MMFMAKISRLAVAPVLIGLVSAAPPVAAQEYASIQSQCQREAQDYGVEPEHLAEYVSGCVQAYGGMPEAARQAETQPADAGTPVTDEPAMNDSGEPDGGAALE